MRKAKKQPNKKFYVLREKSDGYYLSFDYHMLQEEPDLMHTYYLEEAFIFDEKLANHWAEIGCVDPDEEFMEVEIKLKGPKQ